MVQEGKDANLVERRPYQKKRPLVSTKGWWLGSSMKVSAINVMIAAHACARLSLRGLCAGDGAGFRRRHPRRPCATGM